MIERIFNSEYMNIGSGIQPFNAWLLLRGLRTLPLRLQAITETTKQMVTFLQLHPKVEEVIFPFDPAFPQYDLAKKQMKGACGLLTFILKTHSIHEIEKFCNSLQHIKMAVSWGGYESLIIPRCAGIQPKTFDPNEPLNRSIRLYVGLEAADYLMADINQAFEA